MSEAETTLTMVEVLEKQRDLEEEATEKANEGWGDEHTCTHSQGAIRQAVFACLTCSKESQAPVGVCFACSLSCHLNHDVRELYFKHGFACDCGTDAHGSRCTMAAAGEVRHCKNKAECYTHNFRGLFCWCEKPYDDANGEPELMVQCRACEDWFHEGCIGERVAALPIPNEGEFEDLLCDRCTEACSGLLSVYGGSIHFGSAVPLTPPSSCPRARKLKADSAAVTTATPEEKTRRCSFLRFGWTKALCRCDECCSEYAKTAWPWLFEPHDSGDDGEDTEEAARVDPAPAATETETDANGREAATQGNTEPTALERLGMQAMIGDREMGSVRKIELVHAFEDLSGALRSFLATKAAAKETVTREDIDTFFRDFPPATKRGRC